MDSGIFLEKGIDISEPVPDPLMSVTECKTEEEVIALVDTVLLGNVEPEYKDNFSFTGDPRAVGYFTGGTMFGFEQNTGLVMTTGLTSELNSANHCEQILTTLNFGDADDDLEQLSGENVYDACVIEFDIKNTGDSIDFNTVFASEDYHEWVNTFLVDAYGVFISGPGIDGTFSNNAVNTGLVPGTDLPVNVNNLNCGYAELDCNQELPGGEYCEWLNDNLNTDNTGFYSTPFNGYTFPIPAGIKLQQNEWYHIKIAIGDCVQFTFDSGLFIESGMNTIDSVNTAIADLPVEQEILISPNPAGEVVRVELSNNTQIDQVNLYDLSGRKLRAFPDPSEEFNLSALPKGLIIIEVKTDNQTLRSKLVRE
jgi:hypothetical protein